MTSRAVRRMLIALVTLGALALAASAFAAKVQNGGFEDGLAGWHKNSHGDGQWATSIDPNGAPFNSPPPEGVNAAYGSQGDPSSDILYQDVKLPDHGKLNLKFWAGYNNEANRFATPNSLSTGPTMGPPDKKNQQFRVDVMKPSAPLRSLKDADVLKRVFRTERDDPLQRDWFKVSAGVTKLAGKKVRLRFAEVDNLFYFTVGVDDVRVASS